MGIFVGAAGLTFTAVATYYDARVSAGQLRQSQDDADKESRRQAMRVAAWGDLGQRVHVMNRSPDPVSDVQVHVTIGYFMESPDGLSQVRERYLLTADDLPPCSKFVLPPSLFGNPEEVGVRWIGIIFSDADGAKWTRTKGGLEPTASRAGRVASKRLDGEYGTLSEGNHLQLLDREVPEGAVSVEKVEPCSADPSN